MLDAGKGMYFSHVVLGNYFRHYKLPELEINSLSWHGYYKIIDGKQLYSPVVHVKSHGTKIDRVGHLGSINSFEPVMVKLFCNTKYGFLSQISRLERC